MNAELFLGLEPTSDPAHWRLPITPRICSGIGALFGGCGLAAAIAVLEVCTGRNLIWAAAQYLRFAVPPSTVDLHVTEFVRGHQMSQAQVVASVGGEPVIVVSSALGSRSTPWTGDFAVMPDVPPPDACEPRAPTDRWRDTFQSHLDARIAAARAIDTLDGSLGSGHAALWVRGRNLECDVATLGILGDYVPWGIGQALGLQVGGNSLDNTFRVVHRPQPSDAHAWVLVDVHIYAVANGFAHGRVHLWSETGRLFATAGQSVVAREWDRPPNQARVSRAHA
ncbi:MAG: thioesterase family protein [Acidimicrobiia bacterium]